MRNVIFLLFFWLMHAAPTQGAKAVPGYDHIDPVVLNEFAIASVRRGDLATARILLERAALLAPHDQRIGQNLRVLKASRAGVLLPPAELKAAPQGTQVQPRPSVVPVPAPPPALWPAQH